MDAALGEAIARHRRGDLAGAIAAYRALIKASPDNAEGQHYLGLALVQSGKGEEGLEALKRACELAPDNAMFRANLGKAALKLNDLETARAAFDQATQIAPNDFESWNNLAGLYRQAGALDDALTAYETALQLKRHPAIAFNLGLVAKDLGRRDRARTAFQDVLQMQPRDVQARMQLTALASEDGDFDGASAVLDEAMRIAPDNPRILAALLTQRAYTPSAELMAHAHTLAARQDLDEEDRARLGFGLARAEQRAGHHDQAWQACALANDIVARRAPFDAARLEREIVALESTFDENLIDQLSKAHGGGERLVFIVGLPRTGTTLVEQILASHAEVFGADERPDIPALVAELDQRVSGQGGYPVGLSDLTADEWRALAERHEARVHALAPAASRIVDKLPFNFSHIGLIAGLFPKAQIVHCTRDLRDVFLSCFFTEFTESLQAFRTSPENFTDYARLYQRLMAHWEQVLPGRLLHMRYERLIEDIETHARDLVDHLGLEWDPACLRFHETERTVRTPSRWQVRQPVYSSSVGRWRNYESYLGPVADLA